MLCQGVEFLSRFGSGCKDSLPLRDNRTIASGVWRELLCRIECQQWDEM